MENMMVIAVWVIAIVISFVPLPLMYRIIGIALSIVFIGFVTYNAKRANRLTTVNLIINILIIGWDIAILYQSLAR